MSIIDDMEPQELEFIVEEYKRLKRALKNIKTYLKSGGKDAMIWGPEEEEIFKEIDKLTNKIRALKSQLARRV